MRSARHRYLQQNAPVPPIPFRRLRSRPLSEVEDDVNDGAPRTKGASSVVEPGFSASQTAGSRPASSLLDPLSRCRALARVVRGDLHGDERSDLGTGFSPQKW